MMANRLTAAIAVALALVATTGCVKENYQETLPEVEQDWTISIAAKNMLPAVPNRNDSGTVKLYLYTDNSLGYEMTISNFADVLTGARIRAGNPVTAGSIVLDFTATSKYPAPNALGGTGYGVLTNVRQSFIDSLRNPTTQLYWEMTSIQQPGGLARGQLNNRVVMAADVRLTGSAEVPPVTTTATGQTWLRVTDDQKLYSRITIANNEPGDPFTMAHIHRGAANANGPVLLTLAASNADFGESKTIDLDASLFNTVLTGGNLYINAHSQLFPAGKIRGQLRN